VQSLEKVLEDKLKKIEGRLSGELKCIILLCNYEMFPEAAETPRK
jgi:hypothetical protein